jgi:hypothetical protein
VPLPLPQHHNAKTGPNDAIIVWPLLSISFYCFVLTDTFFVTDIFFNLDSHDAAAPKPQQ